MSVADRPGHQSTRWRLFVRTADISYTYMHLSGLGMRSWPDRSAPKSSKGGARVSQLTVNRTWWVVALAIILALVLSTQGAAEPAESLQPGKTKEHFLRIERDPAGHELALQTAIVRFESDLADARDLRST